jgi:hypothetical protein
MTNDELADYIGEAHAGGGGYFCACGLELNSPKGHARHVVSVTLAYLEGLS